MDNERTAVITIGEEEYTLLLTTKATKEIAGRYGGLENLGEKLMKSENFEMAIGEIVWLITLLYRRHRLPEADTPAVRSVSFLSSLQLLLFSGFHPEPELPVQLSELLQCLLAGGR